MAIKGLIIDLFGTLVKEDDGAVVDLCRAVMDSSPSVMNPGEVARCWWQITNEYYLGCFGNEFLSLKDLELNALQETADHFHSSLPVKESLLPIFRSRLTPELYEDSRLFMSRLPLPAVVITNGDRADVEYALTSTQLPVEALITSEDVKSYKPRADIFKAALEHLGLKPEEVLMVGDSLRYDLEPAHALGINTAWINRSRKSLGDAPTPDLQVASLAQPRALMLHGK